MGLLDTENPSAISAMLQGLLATHPAIQQTPGGPQDMPQVGGMPMQAPPMATPDQPRHSMVDRLHTRLSGLLDSAKSEAPAGYNGLLSADEQQSAQPGRGESIIGRVLGLGSDVFTKQHYRQNLDQVLKMKEHAQGLAQEKQHMALRAQVGGILADTKMSPDDRFAALTKMLGTAFQIGDEKSIGSIANAMQSAKPVAPKAAPTYEPKAFKLKDGSIGWVKPGEPVPEGATPFHEPPQIGPDRTIVQVEGPDGPMWATREQAIGMPAKKAGAAGSAQNAASEALLRSSVSEMHNADSYMKSYENDLASGKKSINGLSQFMGGIGNSFTHDDPASRAVQNVALTALNKVNPDLARYIRRGLSFAEGEAGISKRPSDFRTKMAAFLSTASSGASPELISDIQGRRSSILVPLHDVVSKMGGSTSKGSGSVTGSKLDAYRHLLQ